MGILFLMPNWAAPSEVWMQRMLEELEPHLAAVVCREAPERTWRGKVPAVALQGGRSIWRRLARRAARGSLDESQTRLLAAVEDPGVTLVLANYLAFALEFMPVWERTAKPLFVQSHGYDASWDLRTHEAPDRPCFPADYPRQVVALSRRAMMIANPFTSRQLQSAGVAEDRIAVKFYGVPAPERPPVRPERERNVRVLFVGRLIDCKGPDQVIRAFDRACDLGFDGELTIAGDGPLRIACELLRRQARHSGRMRMLGVVDPTVAARLRREADLLTMHNCTGPLTRQQEACPVSVVEAMADGLPVINASSGGVADVMVDGETGILVEPGDVEGHAQALLRLGRDVALRRRMGLAGWLRARERFSMEEERRAFCRILQLGRSARAAA